MLNITTFQCLSAQRSLGLRADWPGHHSLPGTNRAKLEDPTAGGYNLYQTYQKWWLNSLKTGIVVYCCTFCLDTLIIHWSSSSAKSEFDFTQSGHSSKASVQLRCICCMFSFSSWFSEFSLLSFWVEQQLPFPETEPMAETCRFNLWSMVSNSRPLTDTARSCSSCKGARGICSSALQWIRNDMNWPFTPCDVGNNRGLISIEIS